MAMAGSAGGPVPNGDGTSADADIGHISGRDLGVHYTKHNLRTLTWGFSILTGSELWLSIFNV